MTDEPDLDIVIVTEEPTAAERLEMLRSYFEEQRSLGRQLVALSPVGSVRWLHSQWLVEEASRLLELGGGKG